MLSELDASSYAGVQSLSLMLAASAHNHDAFCSALPAFLAQLDSTSLHTLTLGFSLFRPTHMYWTFVDWPALDAALAALRARVVFRFAFVPAPGPPADVAAPLAERLPQARAAGTALGVRCDLFDQMAGVPLREGALRWLASQGSE